MEAGSERLLGIPSLFRSRDGGRRGCPGGDGVAEAREETPEEKRAIRRGTTEELLRRATDVDPGELESLRERAERRPERLTLAQELRLHDMIKQLAAIRLIGAEEIEITDPISKERAEVVSGSNRGGIQRITHIVPDSEEMGTDKGILGVRPVYVPHFLNVAGEPREVFWQENTVGRLDRDGEPMGTVQITSRQSPPDQIARLIPLLRDGEVAKQIWPELHPGAEDQAEA
ncbi:MAG: hypothetical protein WD926_00190 [Patescibacteria group bacterium]